MSSTRRTSAAAGRDAGLRRLQIVNRGLASVMLGLTALLADMAAQAFPGHARTIVTPTRAETRHPAHGTRSSARSARRAPGHRQSHPDPRTGGTSAAAAAPSASQPVSPPSSAPAPAPATVPGAPAPVVSGGS